MEQESLDSSFTIGINQQFDNLFGGRSSDLGVKVFTEFAEVFLSGIETRIQNFSQALEDQDYKQFQLLSHQLRGSLRTLGAHSLADALQKIEEHIKTEPSPNHMQLVGWRQIVIDGVPGLIRDLRSFVGSLKSAS